MIAPSRPWPHPPMRLEGERLGNLSGKDGGPGAGAAVTLKALWVPSPWDIAAHLDANGDWQPVPRKWESAWLVV